MINTKSLFLNTAFIISSSLVVLLINTNAFALTPDEDTSLPLSHLKKFSEVYLRIKNDYVQPIDEKKLINDAISGMLKGLDPHSDYLDETRFQALNEGTSGEFGGLGIEVGQENGFIKVISPIDGTPAKKAGIQSGDIIIRLNNQSVKSMSLNDATQIMRGKPGEAIDIVVTRKGTSKPITINLVRAVIKVKSVNYKLLEENYGYIRISSFQNNTTEDTRHAIDSLTDENKTKLKGLILDLRDNPGGLLTAAVGVSDTFIDSGNIVYTEGRTQDTRNSFDASTEDMLQNASLVILVNQGSASASEIVAGALQDHKRALILGTKTFGKGSVQTIMPLNKKTGLKLTTARYFTPLGNSIQAKGIQPDITIEALEIKHQTNKPIAPLFESDLNGHLNNPEDKPNKNTKNISSSNDLTKNDFQLYESLNILKSIELIRLIDNPK